MKKECVRISGHSLVPVVADALAHLAELGYSRTSLKRFRTTWRTLVDIAERARSSQDLSTFTDRLLLHYRVPTDGSSRDSNDRHYRAAVRIIREFAQNGRFRRRRAAAVALKLRPDLEAFGVQYDVYCRQHLKVGDRTMRGRNRCVSRFLEFLDERQLGVSTVTPSLVSQFITDNCHLGRRTMRDLTSHVRCFFRFLELKGEIGPEARRCLPHVRIRPDEGIPSAWCREELDAFLKAVDRRGPRGKRDYAMLLLACRLGMRIGDIRDLRLENILWDGPQIEFVQSKTEKRITLPITDEVAEALIDYLRHARPTTVHRHVFLRLTAPYAPFGPDNNLHYLVGRYRLRASLSSTPGQKRGFHSLRHTAATQLLKHDTPLATISEILGHSSTESTRIYTKIDVESLRTASLDPEAING